MSKEMILYNMLTEERKKFETVSKELSRSPKGRLLRVNRNNKRTFYHDQMISGKRVRKAIDHNPKMMTALAHKMYLEEAKVVHGNNVKLLERFYNEYRKGFSDTEPSAIIRRLPEMYRTLPEKMFLGDVVEFESPDDMDAKYIIWEAEQQKVKNDALFDVERYSEEIVEWAQRPYSTSDYMEEYKVHVTSQGLLVRSKSEVAIAEKLYEYKIPFRYEERLEIDGYIMLPDFVVPNVKGTFYYWEHCGLPNDKDYMRRHKRKIEQYEQVGIVPWKNLIVTYDDELGTINMKIIESEIVSKLL